MPITQEQYIKLALKMTIQEILLESGGELDAFSLSLSCRLSF